MKEFFFTWRIENISYFWHQKGEVIASPSFVADTLQNTSWVLRLWFDLCTDCISLCLYRGEDKGPDKLIIDCEFSCVSLNNLKLISHISPKTNASLRQCSRIGSLHFLNRHEVFGAKRSLYLPLDVLTLQCRMWKREGGDHEFGQCFGTTRLEIERILSVEDMNPRISKDKTIFIRENKKNELLVTVGLFHEKECLKLEINPTNTEAIKFSTFKLSATGRNREPFEYIGNWLDKSMPKFWRAPFSTTGNKFSIKNKLKLTCEFIYSTGEETKSVEKINPCSFKFPDFALDSMLSCIPSGKLSDCPSVFKDLWDLYQKQILCDVQLKTRTASFWVHKTILCARSPVFLAMFTFDMKEKASKCVEIEDLEDNILDKFLTFLYTDNLEEQQYDVIVQLYYAGDKYLVKRLKLFCCSYFLKNISDVRNACELLLLADKHNDSYLKSKVENHIMKHRKRIFRSYVWKKFSTKHPVLTKTMICKNKKTGKRKSDEENKLSNFPNVFEDLKSLHNSQAMSDIVIQTASATFPAHKAILCAGSLKLRKLLTSSEPYTTLKLEDLEVDTVSRLLLFLYTDSLGKIKWKEATTLYRSAFIYQIERLKISCSCFFLEKLKVSNATYLLKLALEHQDLKLESLVKDFMSVNDKDITLSEVSSEIGKNLPPKRRGTASRQSKRLRLENDS